MYVVSIYFMKQKTEKKKFEKFTISTNINKKKTKQLYDKILN